MAKLDPRAEWLEEAIARNGSKILRTAFAMLGSMAEAEDAVQDVFLTLFERHPHFESPEHEAAWLIRVTVNRCKNLLRSHRWKKTIPLADTHPAQTERQHELLQIINALPAKYRLVIHLFYYEGYLAREIAQITKQKESTVREQLTRARRMLKEFLEEEQA